MQNLIQYLGLASKKSRTRTVSNDVANFEGYIGYLGDPPPEHRTPIY